MFGTSYEPKIDISYGEIYQKAQELSGKLSISGTQPKLSIKLDRVKKALIVTAEGGEYILKPQNPVFPDLPQNEQCCMDIAAQFEIEVPPHCLLYLKDGSPAYIIKRFDRENGVKIHQEDFTQILGTDKYSGSVEQIGKVLKEKSTAPGYDMQLLFERVILNFLIGNGDAHLKNYSLSYKEGNIRLTPAYDIVCSKILIPDEEESALTINGKKNKLKKDDFDRLAEYLHVPIKIRYEKFLNVLSIAMPVVESSEMDIEKQSKLIEIITERSSRLTPAHHQ